MSEAKKAGTESPRFTVRLASEKDADEILAVMEAMPQTIPNQDWFVAGDREWILSHLSPPGGFTLAAVAEEGDKTELAGFFIVDFPGMSEENLGRDLGFSEKQLMLTAHMDYAAVLPAYRGYHLQSRMTEAAERELEHYPHRYLFCTIHPENHASLHTMLRQDYVIVATKEKYGGLPRHILYKKKEPPVREKPDILVSACLLGVHCRYNGKGVLAEGLSELRKLANLIPVCPEILGGLPTPRDPAEQKDGRVITAKGGDVTRQYRRGAEETLALGKLYHVCLAVLKERSPSCGSGAVYDGTHTGTLIPGDGVTAALLKANGIPVFGESDLEGEGLKKLQGSLRRACGHDYD